MVDEVILFGSQLWTKMRPSPSLLTDQLSINVTPSPSKFYWQLNVTTLTCTCNVRRLMNIFPVVTQSLFLVDSYTRWFICTCRLNLNLPFKRLWMLSKTKSHFRHKEKRLTQLYSRQLSIESYTFCIRFCVNKNEQIVMFWKTCCRKYRFARCFALCVMYFNATGVVWSSFCWYGKLNQR